MKKLMESEKTNDIFLTSYKAISLNMNCLK